MKSVCCDSNRRVIATLAAIGLCFTAVSTTPAVAPAAPVFAGTCDTTGTKARVSTTTQTTGGSSSFVPVIETTIPFTQRRTGCVIVSFSAKAASNTSARMYVTAVVDGFGCAPYDILFVASDQEPIARAMNFVCPDIGTGNHTAKIMFRSTGPAGAVLYDRTTILHYSK